MLGVLTGCGTSPEEVATQTAVAWTATPPLPTATSTAIPSPTATLVPYNMSLTVKNANGEPITDALVTVETATEVQEVTDPSGTVSFSDLGSNTIKVKASASGYFAFESDINIERGENQVEIVLERDPYGLLPAQACAPGENILLIEDVQDQAMQGWGDLSAKLESGVPGIEIVEVPDQPGNWVLKTSSLGKDMHLDVTNYDQVFDDAVIRLRAIASGKQHYHLGWHRSDGGNGYIAFIYAEQNAFGGRVDKFVDGASFTAINFPGNYGDGKWHFFEISTYQGEYQIWIDGVERGKWLDKQPIPKGRFSLAQDFWSEDAYALFDDFSVCALNAPFQTIVTK